MELLVEFIEEVSVDKVDEAVSDIALVFDIARQVQEIVCVGQNLIDFI